MPKLRQTLALLDAEGEALQNDLINPQITDKEMLRKAIEGNTADWLTKVNNIGRLLVWWKRDKDFIKNQRKMLKETLESMEERETWLRETTCESMIAKGETKLTFPDVTVYIQKNEPSIEIEDAKMIPSQFQKLVPAHFDIDVEGLLQHFKKTGEIPNGVRVIVNKTHLVVR